MINDNFKDTVDNQLAHCRDILLQRAEVYTPGSDRLSNFKQAAGAQSITNEAALVGMMTKHYVALCDFSKKPDDVPIEQWEEKITDGINYLLLLKALVVERKAIEEGGY